MTIAPGALQTLHRIHRQLTDLRERLARGPKQIAAAEAGLKQAEQAVVQAKEAYKKARMTGDEKQLHLKQREARLHDLQGKLNACDSNREFQALREQIAADQKANSVLEDEILESIEIVEKLQAQTKELEGNATKVREELERVRQRVAATHAGLETEIERVHAELLVAEERLPPDFKVEYLRVSRQRGERALAPLEHESCGGCFQNLTPQNVNDVNAGRAVFCKNCGSLLYPAEEDA